MTPKNNEQLTQNRYVAGPVAFAPALPPLRNDLALSYTVAKL
jgi:hypothetical protein